MAITPRSWYDDYVVMSDAIRGLTARLGPHYQFGVALHNGSAIPMSDPEALPRKLEEYLQRARRRFLAEQVALGAAPNVDYPTFVMNLPADQRHILEGNLERRAWRAAKGHFLEVLCLVADMNGYTAAPGRRDVVLFAKSGAIPVLDGATPLFLWCQPTLTVTRSGMNACPDIVLTNAVSVEPESVVGIRECKAHRRIPSDEIRKECGKAYDLDVSSYVIVAYHHVRRDLRRGAQALGIDIEELDLDTSVGESYRKGERDLGTDLVEKLSRAGRAKSFGKMMERSSRSEMLKRVPE